jgi:transposase InsO family protein
LKDASLSRAGGPADPELITGQVGPASQRIDKPGLPIQERSLVRGAHRPDLCGGFGKPEIFDTDQRSQFTSTVFTGRLTSAGIRTSRDGRSRWIDKVFIERLWRSMKYEEVT